MRRREGCLFGFSVVVLRVSVQDQLAYGNQRVVTVWPDLRNVINIESVIVCVLDGHKLDIPGPAWEIALLDVLEKVVGGEVLVFQSHFCGFRAFEVLDALVRFVMVLDKVNIA